MADPQRKPDSESSIRPDLRAIDGGGETTPDRASLRAVEASQDLQDRENAAASNVIQGPWGSRDSDSNNDSTDAVRDAEDRGGWSNNVSSSYAGNRSKSGKGISKANFKAVLKKRGPLAAIITLICGGGIGLGAFFGPSLLLVQLQESLLSKFDTQNTSMTIRSDKLIANKIAGDSTSGSCNIVQVACRFSRPSNKLLKNLEANGVTALDKDGAVIKRTGLFQPTRPVTYVFEGKPIAAKDFYSTLRSDAKFRAAFHNAYNPRFAAFTDFVFKGIQKRFGFDTSDKNKDGTKTATEDLNDSSKTASAVAGEAEEGADGVVKKLITSEAGKAVSKIAAGGKGDAIGLVAAAGCTLADAPSLVTRTVRAFQLVQLVNYATKILTIGSKLKSGDLGGAEASSYGSLLTTPVNGKSAMDSYGIQYTMFGAQKAKTDSYKKFSPGASAINLLGPAVQALSSPTKKTICDIATNPATGTTINAALALNAGETFGATLVIAGVNIIGGLVLSSIIDAVATPLITQIVQNIDVKPLLNFFVGDLTQNLAGEDVGNALVSGASNLMSQTANAGGNMPLTVADAVAYNQTTQNVNIAYAQEDRATLSPFDPTNQNTVVGSIVSGLLPYISKMSSISGAIGSIISIPASSISSLLSSSVHAASDVGDYTLCEDPSITDAGVAAGPFCNVVYGIPPQYLGMDPQQIVNYLINSNDVDPLSGDPINRGDTESLYRWVTTCTDGATDQLKNCEIVDEKTAMYSLYTIDHRIQKGMDEDDGTFATQSASTTPSSDSIATTDNTSTDSTVLATLMNTAISQTPPSISKPTVEPSPSVSSNLQANYAGRLNQNWYWSVA